MSTSSGREGFCSRCGHANNEHAKESRCKRKTCKKAFEICQAPVHGKNSGWRICYIPCFCGKNYYPDKAKAAVPLEPHEYIPEHPGYRPLVIDDDDDEDDDDEDEDEDEDDSLVDKQSEAEVPVGTEDIVATPQRSGHTRNDSEESEDPLAWSPETYQRRLFPMETLIDGMNKATIEDPGSMMVEVGDWSGWQWNPEFQCESRYRKNAALKDGWEYEYRKVGNWSSWEWNPTHQCESRHRENAELEGGWEFEYRNTSGSKSGGKGKGKHQGKGKGKGKAK